MPTFMFGKLVRDKIIDRQLQNGARPVYRELKKDEHARELLRKVIEETRELAHAEATELASEVADVRQALDDLCSVLGVAEDAVATAQREKYQKNGGFLKGVFIERVELSEDDSWVSYYRAHPDRYPELD